MLQVGTGEGVGLYLGDTAGVHVLPKQSAEDHTDPRLALAAFSGKL
jgi:hypothetical protein